MLTNLHDTEGPRGLFNSLVACPFPLYLSFPARKHHLYLLPYDQATFPQKPFEYSNNRSVTSLTAHFSPSACAFARLRSFPLSACMFLPEGGAFSWFKKKEALILWKSCVLVLFLHTVCHASAQTCPIKSAPPSSSSHVSSVVLFSPRLETGKSLFLTGGLGYISSAL